MWRKKGHLKVAEKNRKWRKKILELAGDQSQNMVTMQFSLFETSRLEGSPKPSSLGHSQRVVRSPNSGAKSGL